MAENNDLYTDYALQIFSSYVKDDLNSMELILESFKNDGKNVDNMFMPGLIYGLMFHWSATLNIIANNLDTTIEKLLEDYAMDYALAREELLDNPLLNVNKARDVLDQLIESIEELNRMIEEGDF